MILTEQGSLLKTLCMFREFTELEWRQIADELGITKQSVFAIFRKLKKFGVTFDTTYAGGRISRKTYRVSSYGIFNKNNL